MKLHTLINHYYGGFNVTFSKYRCKNVAYEPVIASQILKDRHHLAFILALTKDSSPYDRCVIYYLPQGKIDNYPGWAYASYVEEFFSMGGSAPILDSLNAEQ